MYILSILFTFRVNDGYVQWKYTSNSEWINLYKYLDDDVADKVYIREDNKIYFGYYPQTLEKRNTIVNTLTTYAGMLPTSENSYNWIDCGYYISNNVESYMWYIDLDTDFDGRYDYRGVYFTKYRPTNISSESKPENATQDNNGYYPENVYWFKYELIEWDIIKEENSKALLISNYMLDTQEYCETDRTDQFERSNGETGYANNYKLSTIRAWLNDDFYNTAFIDAEKEIIDLTTVKNDETTTISSPNPYTCANTEDYVFLLSYEEAASYYLNKESRITSGSDYAKCQGLFTNDDGNSQWRLRSPNPQYSNSASYVTSSGELKMEYVDIISRGERPALWIELQ